MLNGAGPIKFYSKKGWYLTMNERERNDNGTIYEQVKTLCAGAKRAAPAGASASTLQKQEALRAMRRHLLESEGYILSENGKDLSRAKAEGMRVSMQDRLRLTPERLRAMADALENLARFSDPIGQGTYSVRPNGLQIRKVRVPLGAVAMIYEARPCLLYTSDAADD